MIAPIPDPDAPEMRAIDSETGELLGGLFLLDNVADPAAVTLDELRRGTHIGWLRSTAFSNPEPT